MTQPKRTSPRVASLIATVYALLGTRAAIKVSRWLEARGH